MLASGPHSRLWKNSNSTAPCARSITRRRANRRCSGWPCRRGGRRLRVGCLGDVEGPDGGGSGCWQVVRTAVCGRTAIAPRLALAPSRGGEQIDDVLDGLVGAVVGGFESAVWAMLRVRTVVEAAVGKWSAQPFVEEQK